MLFRIFCFFKKNMKQCYSTDRLGVCLDEDEQRGLPGCLRTSSSSAYSMFLRRLCGLVLGALGADVILTDLATRLPLLKKNLAANISLLRGEVSVKVLDWCSHVSISDVDLLVLVDCLYYRSSVQPLIDTIKSCNASEILCVYEKRDIGEPLVAQQMFIQLVSKYYELNYVPDYELDPNYCSGDIPVIKLVKK
uniref:Methyltransferase-like protein 23 n=1 Tax=Heterorhabditis bacteriophora TaxID=37862 RepID=A0A1I7XR81_HETBA